MSQTKRYNLAWTAKAEDPEQGAWVEYSDYAALAAENERLRSYINEIECIGDDLAGMVGHADVTGDAHQMMLELYDAWLAAKEGRDAK